MTVLAFWGCTQIAEAARDVSIRDLTKAVLRSTEELHGPVRLVVPVSVDPRAADVLLGLGAIPIEELDDPETIPAGHALFEGLIIDDDRAEAGIRVGPFDRRVPGESCGTKYRLSFERTGDRWLLRRYILGGC